MKQTLFFIIIVFSLNSCKSQRDVSRSVVAQTRGESLVTVNDTSKTHLETLLNSEVTRKEKTNTYKKETYLDSMGNMTKMIETLSFINLQVDFKSQLNQLKREDFKYSAATQTTDTTSTVVQEKEKETSDSRPIQGWDWLLVIVGIIAFAGYFIGGYDLYKKIIR